MSSRFAHLIQRVRQYLASENVGWQAFDRFCQRLAYVSIGFCMGYTTDRPEALWVAVVLALVASTLGLRRRSEV